MGDEFRNSKNYIAGDDIYIGGKVKIKNGGIMPNQADQSGTAGSDAKTSINALLKKLKNAGLMTGDTLTVAAANNVNDTVAGHADRTYNTGKISSVACANGVITITLSDKVKNLKDFEGGNGWGRHKWLGIDVSCTGISPITSLYYNGQQLTNEDVTEATAMGLSAGHFVRWVAADLVLAGDNTQKSKNVFTLWADGCEEAEVTLAIVEPAE